MKWSFSLGRLADIDIRVHATFFLLLVWVAWSSFTSEGTVAAALNGVALISLLFGTVVLHELGHALTARRYGIATQDITLLPIGGVARLERMPDNPRHELLVAVAGPAVNVALAAALGLALVATDQPFMGGAGPASLLGRLFWINISLACFNMAPAFPMDGGRALRAVLAMRMDGVRATEIAARLGKTAAVALGILGLFVSPIMILVAVFIWLGAGAEVHAARFEGALAGITVAAATIREFHAIQVDDPLDVPVVHALAGFQHDFPVTDHGQVVGLLPHRALLQGITERGLTSRVGESMVRDAQTVRPDDMLVDAVRKLEARESRCLLVADRGRLLGLLTLAGVGELFTVREAIGGHPPGGIT